MGLGLFLVPALAAGAGDPKAIRINEILADNRNTTPTDSQADFEDMVELYNPTDEAISLQNFLLANVVKEEDGKIRPVNPWKITAGSISPRRFVLIFCDDDADPSDIKGSHASFRLDQEGEVVALFSPDSELIDMVVFPRLPEGTSYGRYPDGSETLCHLSAPTFRPANIAQGGTSIGQNLDCAGNLPPEVNLRSYDSLEAGASPNPAPDAPQTLIATSWDDKEDGTASVRVVYHVDDGPVQEVVLAWDGYLDRHYPPSPPGTVVEDKKRSRWKGTLPGQPAGSVVTFYLHVTDKSAATGSDPEVLCTGGQTINCRPPFRYRVDYRYQGPLVLNEVLPLNGRTVVDPTDQRYEDYIELYSAEELILENLWISNDPFDPTGWEFPTGSRIIAGDHLIVWCDDDNEETRPLRGRYHTNFNLSAEGEGVFLFDTQANGYGFIDGLNFPAILDPDGNPRPDRAWHRVPDGDRTVPFVEGTPTPGTPNGIVVEPEFMRGDADGEGGLDIADPILILNYLFQGAGEPPCLDAVDVNDDGMVEIADPLYLLQHLFLGGLPPKPPSPERGPDPTDDDLGCAHPPVS